jgi:hypothetical protein
MPCTRIWHLEIVSSHSYEPAQTSAVQGDWTSLRVTWPNVAQYLGIWLENWEPKRNCQDSRSPDRFEPGTSWIRMANRSTEMSDKQISKIARATFHNEFQHNQSQSELKDLRKKSVRLEPKIQTQNNIYVIMFVINFAWDIEMCPHSCLLCLVQVEDF